MQFPVVLEKAEGSDYGAVVPDLPGCVSAGADADEALAMVREAIELHLEGLIAEGEPIPQPGRIEQYKDDPEYRDGIWALVSIQPSSLRQSAKRVSVTIPERVLDAMDQYAKGHDQTRSGLIVEAVARYMGRTEYPKPRRGPRKKNPGAGDHSFPKQ
jgi:predicted RNase H-like HicB family nuclease